MKDLRKFGKDHKGVAAIEFAIAGPLFLMALMGIFDYCWQIYGKAVLQGAVAQAARNATLEQYIDDPSALDERVRSQVQNIFRGSEVRFSRAAFDSFEQIGKPEPFTDSSPKNGKYDRGECFEDLNGNGIWDAISTGRAGSGGADDIVLYTATADYLRVLPVWRMLNQPQAVTLSASTILRNQPYGVGTSLHKVICD